MTTENENGTFDGIATEIIDNIPPVSEHVVSEFEETTETVTETVQQNQPLNDDVFNPEIHAVDSVGNPVKTKAGKFARKRGRKSGTETAKSINHNSSLGGSSQPENQIDTSKVINADVETIAIFGTLIASQTRCFLGGSAANDEERKYLESSFRNWAEASEVVMSPTTGLILALTVFNLPVIVAPKEQNKFYKFGIWLKSKFTKKGAIPASKKDDEENAHFN